MKYDIKRKVHNIMDIKTHFWYSCLLNHNNWDQFMNLYIQIYYPSIGPAQAFGLWWSVHVFQNLGEKEFLKYIKITNLGNV